MGLTRRSGQQPSLQAPAQASSSCSSKNIPGSDPVMLGSVTLCSSAGTARLSGWNPRHLGHEDTSSLPLGGAFLKLPQNCFFPPPSMSAFPQALDDIHHPPLASAFTPAAATTLSRRTLPGATHQGVHWSRCSQHSGRMDGVSQA